MLAHRLRRWANIIPALGQLVVFAGYSTWYWQSQAVTHPIMDRARRCLTSVIEPTQMS